MGAIKATGSTLAAVLDKKDSVGFIDSCFSSAGFFTKLERFDRHIDTLKRKGVKADRIYICSPNYLYDSCICFALSSDYGAGVNCSARA